MFKLLLCFLVVVGVLHQVAFSLKLSLEGTTSPLRRKQLENVDDKVEQLLQSLSLEAKIGQMVQLDISMFLKPGTAEVDYDKLQEHIVKYEIGSVLNSPFSGGPVKGVTGWTASQWRELILKMQTMSTTLTTGKIPIIYGIDSIHGATFIKDAALFPQALNVAATFNPDHAYNAGTITSKDTRAGGIPWIFSPVLGLGLHPAWARFPETFGEDPYLAAKMGSSIIRGLQVSAEDGSLPAQTAACMKHFIAYSIPHDGHDRSPVLLADRMVRQLYIPSFQAAIDAGVMTGMESYQEVGGVPMVSSKEYLTTLLRKQMKFNNGFLVTDYQEIENLNGWHKVSATIREAVKLAMQETTIDMSMVPLDNSFYDNLLDLVQKNEIPVSRIDDSVRRILRVKQTLGLLDQPLISLSDPLTGKVGQNSDWEASLNTARESIVLAKNADNLLPLAKGSRVLLTGPTADSAISQTGGWALHWQGVYDEDELSQRSTILSSLQQKSVFDGEVVYEPGPTLFATDLSEVDMAGIESKAKSSDVIVVCVGEGTYAEKPGDIDDLALAAGQIQYVQELAKFGKPVVLVAVEGRPRLMHDAVAVAQSVILAMQPGPVGGQAVAEVLAGTVSPSGRLPFTYPRHNNDLVMPYHHKPSDKCTKSTGEHSADYVPCEVEFNFGTGLSYSQFEYSNLLIKAYNPADKGTHIRSDDPTQSITVNEESLIKVSVTIKNSGDRHAKHSVLLYLYDMFRRVTPEYKLLKRFEKIDLAPGESRVVEFEPLSREDLKYVGVESHWMLENGQFRIGLGSSDCRSDSIDKDWYISDADTQSLMPMCAEFTLDLTSGYQPVCDEACGLWSEGICGEVLPASDCKQMCVEQKWTWDYANCLLGYYGESTCSSVSEMQCFNPFEYGRHQKLYSNYESTTVQQPSSPVMIVMVALATALGGLLVGIAGTYWYFSKFILIPGVFAKQQYSADEESDRSFASLLQNEEVL